MAEFTGRVAVYYAPARADALWQRGCAWLGRDAETGEALTQPDGVEELTGSPARYGFHATLKPPMALAGRYEAFLADVKRLAASVPPFEMPSLAVRQPGRFTALCLAEPSPPFHDLADRCVRDLDAHRVPEDLSARRKRAEGRTVRQAAHVERWGYPLVLEDWWFHMTLSQAGADDRLVRRATDFFDGVLQTPRRVEEICVFVEPRPGENFVLRERVALG